MYSYVPIAVTCWLLVLCLWYWQLVKVEGKGLKSIFSIILIGYSYRPIIEGSLLFQYLSEGMKGQNIWSNGISSFSKKTPPQKLGFANEVFCLLQRLEVSRTPEPESSIHLSNGGQQHWNL